VEHLEDIPGVSSTIKHLEHIPFTSHNSVQLLINGQKTYQAMFDAIEQAKDYVLLQFYIIKNDHVGEAFRHLLTEKMQQGVKVYFLYDRLGSFSLSGNFSEQQILGLLSGS